MSATTAPQTGPQLYTALIAAQRAMAPLHKDAKNPGFRSAYATLAAVVDVIEEPLAAHGLVVLQIVEPRESGPVLVTRLVHAPTGESVESVYPILCKDLTDPQKFGGAITYARRYSLMALLSLTPEDDDGNAAATPAPRREQAPAPAPAPRTVSSRADVAAVAGPPVASPAQQREQQLAEIRTWIAAGIITQREANEVAHEQHGRPVKDLDPQQLRTVRDQLADTVALREQDSDAA